MNNSSKSVLVFGTYLIGMGVGFVAMPNALLGMLGFPATDEIWSRVVGARIGLRPFLQWTVYTRIAVFFSFVAFTMTGVAGPMMIVLGSADLVGALWTGWALRRENQTVSGTLPKQAVAQR